MNKKPLFILLIIAPFMISNLPGQSDREFIDKARNFKILLVSDWKPFSYTDAVGRQKTDFIFRNRREGLLTITREELLGRSLSDRVKFDLDDLKLNNVCFYTDKEAFESGHLTGFRIMAQYTEGGRKLISTSYYLEDGDTVWILRFKAEADSPSLALEITDKIARSFCTICPIL